jgi:hypothetical protein
MGEIRGQFGQLRAQRVTQVGVEFAGRRRPIQQQAERGAVRMEDGQVEGLVADVDQRQDLAAAFLFITTTAAAAAENEGTSRGPGVRNPCGTGLRGRIFVEGRIELYNSS